MGDLIKNSQDPRVLGVGGLACPLVMPVADLKEGFMLALWTKAISRLQDEKGASMVEYALLVVLIAIVAIVAIRFAGNQVSDTFSQIGNELATP